MKRQIANKTCKISKNYFQLFLFLPERAIEDISIQGLIRQINVQFYLITYILSNLAQVNQISYLCVIKRMLNFLLICQNFLWTCIHHGIKCGKVTSGTYQNAVKRIELKKITHLLQHTLVCAFD